MKRADMIGQIEDRSKSLCYPAPTKQQISVVLNLFSEICINALYNDDFVIIQGVGTLNAENSIPQPVEDPECPEMIKIQAYKIPHFRFSNSLTTNLKDKSFIVFDPPE